MEFLKLKNKYAWLHKVKPDVLLDQLLGFLEEDMVSNFVVIHNPGTSSLHIMHNCFIEGKQKCRCVKLSPHLIIVKKQTLNCNYFGYNSINQYLWLLGNILSNKKMKLLYGKLDLVLCSTILLSKNGDYNVPFYDKKLAAISGNDFIKSRYELTVNLSKPTKKDIDDCLLGCAEYMDESHNDFILKLNNQTVAVIQSFLWKYLPFTLSDLSRIPDMFNSPYRYFHGNIPEHSQAIKNFQLDY